MKYFHILFILILSSTFFNVVYGVNATTSKELETEKENQIPLITALVSSLAAAGGLVFNGYAHYKETKSNYYKTFIALENEYLIIQKLHPGKDDINKPTRDEIQNCFDYLQEEYKILKNITVILCLGKIAYDATCKLVQVKPEKFGHNKLFEYDRIKILTSYHPSRQNTQTGRLTWKQWYAVFHKAKKMTSQN